MTADLLVPAVKLLIGQRGMVLAAEILIGPKPTKVSTKYVVGPKQKMVAAATAATESGGK